PSPVASERPVSVTQASTAATSLDDDLAEMRAAPRQSTKTFLWVSAAAVAVGLQGAGAFALAGGDDDKAGDTAQAPSPDDAAAALSTSAPAEKPAGSTETTVDTNGPAAEVAA